MRRLIWIFAGRSCPKEQFLRYGSVCHFLLNFDSLLDRVFLYTIEKYNQCLSEMQKGWVYFSDCVLIVNNNKSKLIIM